MSDSSCPMTAGIVKVELHNYRRRRENAMVREKTRLKARKPQRKSKDAKRLNNRKRRRSW